MSAEFNIISSEGQPFDPSGKLGRAKLISTQLQALVAEHGRAIPAAGSAGQRVSRYYESERYRITLTLDCSLCLVARPNNLFEESRVFGRGWTLIELVIAGRRSMILHVREDELELVEFNPGAWERWFGAEPQADTTPFKVPHMPKTLRDLDELRHRALPRSRS
ncbi:MAG: hypothetical protein EON93_01315 [Burkholderiales bacterium]|nr:MAG: hypothetical protein EON93_01315 [Burkholderiales bacterium]